MDYDIKIVCKLISYRRKKSVVPTKPLPRFLGFALAFSDIGVKQALVGQDLRSLILGKVANCKPNLVLPGSFDRRLLDVKLRNAPPVRLSFSGFRPSGKYATRVYRSDTR
jgi:hypothetical protein